MPSSRGFNAIVAEAAKQQTASSAPLEAETAAGELSESDGTDGTESDAESDALPVETEPRSAGTRVEMKRPDATNVDSLSVVTLDVGALCTRCRSSSGLKDSVGERSNHSNL